MKNDAANFVPLYLKTHFLNYFETYVRWSSGITIVI